MNKTPLLQSCLNPFNPSKFINIHLLLTISIQNQLFCCENIRIDHTLQAIQYEKVNSPCLKGKYGYHYLGEFSNTLFVVFGAERVKQSLITSMGEELVEAIAQTREQNTSCGLEWRASSFTIVQTRLI